MKIWSTVYMYLGKYFEVPYPITNGINASPVLHARAVHSVKLCNSKVPYLRPGQGCVFKTTVATHPGIVRKIDGRSEEQSKQKSESEIRPYWYH